MCQSHGLPLQQISPRTRLDSQELSETANEMLWSELRKQFELSDLPRFGLKRWFFLFRALQHPVIRTVSHLVDWVLATKPFMIKARDKGWARCEVAQIIKCMLLVRLGVNCSDTRLSFQEDYGIG